MKKFSVCVCGVHSYDPNPPPPPCSHGESSTKFFSLGLLPPPSPWLDPVLFVREETLNPKNSCTTRFSEWVRGSKPPPSLAHSFSLFSGKQVAWIGASLARLLVPSSPWHSFALSYEQSLQLVPVSFLRMCVCWLQKLSSLTHSLTHYSIVIFFRCITQYRSLCIPRHASHNTGNPPCGGWDSGGAVCGHGIGGGCLNGKQGQVAGCGINDGEAAPSAMIHSCCVTWCSPEKVGISCVTQRTLAPRSCEDDDHHHHWWAKGPVAWRWVVGCATVRQTQVALNWPLNPCSARNISSLSLSRFPLNSN